MPRKPDGLVEITLGVPLTASWARGGCLGLVRASQAPKSGAQVVMLDDNHTTGLVCGDSIADVNLSRGVGEGEK